MTANVGLWGKAGKSGNYGMGRPATVAAACLSLGVGSHTHANKINPARNTIKYKSKIQKIREKKT